MWLLNSRRRRCLSILAFCVATTLDGVQSDEVSSPTAALARAAELDMREWWTPSVQNYLGSVPKARILAVVTGGGVRAGRRALAKLKKAAITTAASSKSSAPAGCRASCEPRKQPHWRGLARVRAYLSRREARGLNLHARWKSAGSERGGRAGLSVVRQFIRRARRPDPARVKHVLGESRRRASLDRCARRDSTDAASRPNPRSDHVARELRAIVGT